MYLQIHIGGSTLRINGHHSSSMARGEWGGGGGWGIQIWYCQRGGGGGGGGEGGGRGGRGGGGHISYIGHFVI